MKGNESTPLDSDPMLDRKLARIETSELPEKRQTATLAPVKETPSGRAALSLLIPGLGQFAQRRFLAGAGQLVAVSAYWATALALSDSRAMWLAIGLNIWSAVEAYRHERR